jgi:hypothetical protein
MGGVAYRDSREDGGGEHVDAGVDAVAEPLVLRLLDKFQNLAVIACDDDAEAGGLVDVDGEQRRVAAVAGVERCEVVEGKLRNDVGVDDKKIAAREDVTEEEEGSG